MDIVVRKLIAILSLPRHEQSLVYLKALLEQRVLNPVVEYY